jgi:glycoside hydrolase family 18
MKKFLLALIGAAACLGASATDYELVTSASDIKAGDNYLIVGKNGTNYYAMGAAQSNNFSGVAVTLDGTTVKINDEAVNVVTLCSTQATDYPYQLEIDGPKYVYAASSSSKSYMRATDDATLSTSNASISVTSQGVATIKFNTGTATARNIMRFNYNNGSPLFNCYASGQADVYLYKEVTTVATVAKPVFSVNTGTYTEAFNVTISCETEGAEIRYTTDESEPDATSTLYTAGTEIPVSATTTLKAIALKGDASSAVATAVYTFPAKYTSLATLLESVPMPENKKNSDTFVVDFEALVAYVNGGNVYIVENGTPALIFKFNLGLNPGDKIKGGWLCHLTNYNGLPELIPESDLETDGTADVPEPAVFAGMDGLAVNSIVKVEGVTFAEATPGTDATDRNFTGTWGADEASLPFYNQFKVASVEAGKYTVLATVGCFNTSIQLQPISYEEYVEPLEPATTTYYVLPLKDMDVADNNEETAFIPTTFYPWYQCASAPMSQGRYNDLRKANIYTFTTAGEIGPEAASGGWLSDGFDITSLRTKDYDLYFSVKTTSDATMAIKLVATEGNEATGNEVLFEAENNGEWQNVRLNIHEKFPAFVNADAAAGKSYVFAFVAGAGLKAGDTFEIANVCYVPAGETPVDPVEPMECPEKLYLIGMIDGASFSPVAGKEMTKEENTFTCSATITGSGYFAFATTLGADADDWNTVNANRLAGAESDAEVTVDTPLELVYSEYSMHLNPGKYDFTVTFADGKASLTAKASSVPDPVDVPEHLYVIGNFANAGWNPAAAVEMTKEGNTFSIIGEATGDLNFGFGTVLGADSSDWDTFNANRYGQAVDNAVVALDTPITLTKNSNAMRLEEAGNYKLTVVFGETEITFTATKESGIEGVDAEAAAPAEYYNLQGVRVENPAEGLYIVVRGGKATKEYVK